MIDAGEQGGFCNGVGPIERPAKIVCLAVDLDFHLGRDVESLFKI